MGRELSRLVIVGHRANSLRKLVRYILDGVEYIEVDVQYDELIGRHIVRHPPDEVWRITTSNNKSRWLSRLYTTLYIKGYIPLENFLDIMTTYLYGSIKGILLDIKDPSQDGELRNTIDTYKDELKLYITSKNHLTIQRLDIRDIKRFVTLMERLYNPENYLSDLDIDGVSIDYRVLDNGYIKELERLGLDIAVWTVNDISSIERLVREGISMIISDVPGKVRYTAEKLLKD